MTAEKEAEYLFDKNVECPVCDSTFRTRVVKTGRVRRLESDFDLSSCTWNSAYRR